MAPKAVTEPPSKLVDTQPGSMTENIYDHGDVVLVVGPEKKKMRVMSTFLMQGSPVFKAMFSGKFAEEDTSLVDIVTLITCAHLLDDGFNFRRISRHLVFDNALTFAELYPIFDVDAMPPHDVVKLLCAVEQERSNVFTEMESKLRLLPSRVVSNVQAYRLASVATRSVDAIQSLVQGTSMKPMFGGSRTITVKEALELLHDFNGYETTLQVSPFSTSSATNAKREMRSLIREVEQFCRGICLVCLSDDSTTNACLH